MFKLPEHVSEAYVKARAEEAAKRTVFANLSDGDLAASAKFWMQHCDTPKQHAPADGVYDATMWHIILPELIRRVEQKSR